MTPCSRRHIGQCLSLNSRSACPEPVPIRSRRYQHVKVTCCAVIQVQRLVRTVHSSVRLQLNEVRSLMHCLRRCFGLASTPYRPKVRSELTQSSTLPRKNVRRTACSATDGPERNRKRKRLNTKRISLGRRRIHLLPVRALKN